MLLFVGMYPAIRNWPVFASIVVLDTSRPASGETYRNRGTANTVKSAAAEKVPLVAPICVYPVCTVVILPWLSILAVNRFVLLHVT